MQFVIRINFGLEIIPTLHNKISRYFPLRVEYTLHEFYYDIVDNLFFYQKNRESTYKKTCKNLQNANFLHSLDF